MGSEREARASRAFHRPRLGRDGGLRRRIDPPWLLFATKEDRSHLDEQPDRPNDVRPAGWRAGHAATGGRVAHGKKRVGGDGGESNSPSRTLHRCPLRACPIVFVSRRGEDRHPTRWPSHVSLDRALSRTTRRSSVPQPRCMTLPQPAGRRLLPRSRYRLSGESESRLLVGRYFVCRLFNEA